jgi:hypothetical protein
MGWSWALYFCQSAMSSCVARALGGGGLCGSLVLDATPSPSIGVGSPVAAVYVDNATVIGATKHDCEVAFTRVKAALTEAKLAFHDVVEPCQRLGAVGLSWYSGSGAAFVILTCGPGGCIGPHALFGRGRGAPAG